jgi:hypothetical protein
VGSNAGLNTLINYDIPYTKPDLLNALCDYRAFVAHGSKRPDLDVLLPIHKSGDSREFGHRQIAFVSPDEMWAMWFTLLGKSRMGGLTKSSCVSMSFFQRWIYKLYYFALPEHVLADGGPFRLGVIYLLTAKAFRERDTTVNLGFA